MAVRIYALAKELKIDSKILVEMCPKAGVTGKGSALASLTDEEADKVRAFVSSGGKPAAKPPIARPAAPVVSAPIPPAPVAPTPIAAPPTSPSVLRREDYMAPAGTSGRIPALASRIDKDKLGDAKKKGGDASKSVSRSGPAIKLAPMPASQQPTAPPKAAEPTPQKPDIKLPADAIRASRAGTKPLSEHIRKHDEKRKAEAAGVKKGGPPRSPTAPMAPGQLPSAGAGRDRTRRGARPGAVVGGPGEEAPGLGGRSVRQLNRKKTGSGARRRRSGEDDDGGRRGSSRQRRSGTNTAAPRKSNVVLELPCTVRSFSEALGLTGAKVLGKLLALQMPVKNINAVLDRDAAELLAAELGVEVNFKSQVDLEQELLTDVDTREDDASLLEPRAPVVTFLGHVDHGKTSLLDKIIGINVARGESGGITQHIRAYQIEKDGRKIAFVDTPGHEAFTAMRARGANVTDIAVLVVAADDGVMPQTEEAINHARAAEVPIVVALNKMDLPGINTERIFQQLAANNLLPAEWGGDTEVVRCSAHTGEGLDKLLETLLLTADLREYKANPRRSAAGVCLEASRDEGRGVVATVLIQRGKLRVGDVIVCGAAFGRVKSMSDTLKTNVMLQEAGPSTPVNMTGLSEAPGAGDDFYVIEDIVAAREIAEKRAAQSRHTTLSGGPRHVTLETLFDHLGQIEVRTLNLIMRADVRGSIEAIQKELTKLQHPEVQIRMLQASVGGVTEADVHLADASDAIIIAFNVVPDDNARRLADDRGVEIRRYEIIYQVSDDLKAALEGLLKPERRDVDLGRALVQRTFSISRLGVIAGCRVLNGTIERNSRVRVIRENRIIGEYGLESLRREKDDAREVREGYECGIRLNGFNDLKEGDILEAYRVEEFARTI